MRLIAADTSSMIAFFAGENADDVQLIIAALQSEQLVLPSPVLSELLSDPKLPQSIADKISSLPRLAIKQGFWQHTGELRAKILNDGRKARLADCLIAQNCLDHDTEIITRDKDFRHFSHYANLKVTPVTEQLLIPH